MKYKLLHIKIINSSQENKLNFPIVLLRGLGRSMSFWLGFQEELSKHFDVILIDLLGTGGSKDLFGRSSILSFAEDVLFTLNYYNFKNFHLAGISMGGMVAIEISELITKEIWQEIKIKSIIVMASSAGGAFTKRIYFKPLVLIFISLLFSFFHGKISHKYYAKYLTSNLQLLEENKIINTWDRIWQTESFSRIALLRQLLAAAFFKIRLSKKKLKYNFMFLVSKNDALVPWINSIYLWQNFPLSELIVLNNLGHDLTTDNPQLIAKILNDFSKKFDA